MGYYTRHTLSVKKGDLEIDYDEKFNEQFEKITGYPIESLLEEETKWNKHEKDMRQLSKEFPDNLFELAGEGEESGDIWIEYYQDGKMQRTKGKVVFDPYDEKEMK